LIRRSASTSTSPSLDIYSVLVATIQSRSLSIPIMIETEKNENVETLSLIDSGAGGMFIDQNYARTKGFKTQKLDEPLTARNVDGTKNKSGTITTFVNLNLKINGRMTSTRLLVTGLGNQKVILGFPWLNEHNPDIDWKNGRLTWRTTDNGLGQEKRFKIKRYHDCKALMLAKQLARQALGPKAIPSKPTITEEKDEEEGLNGTQNPTLDNNILLTIVEELEEIDEVWIQTKTSNSIEFHLKHDEKKDDIPLENKFQKNTTIS
jgi:hypothetical protein